MFNKDLLKEITSYKGKAAVALESTIITHGMPYPTNVEVALKVEEIIREEGAIPLTCAIIDGEIKIGLTKEEIIKLGQAKNVVKASRRDLAYVLANKLTASTTVSLTMILANLAHIKVFATGGIGGVHREVFETLDISADLDEFTKTPVNVICAGPKSILDVEKTMEYLETKGISVVGYKTDVVPLFFTNKSNIKCNISVNSTKELADIIRYNDLLNLNQGSLILNPIPEKDSLEYDFISKATDEAIEEAHKNNVQGKEITPFLLSKIVEKTQGKSLEANVALIKNNALLAAKLAKELAD